MHRIFHAVVLGLATLVIGAQAQTGRVQTIADVSFAVPDGWAYQAATDFGGMAYKEGSSFWFFAVYAPMPTSGDPVADFKTAWKCIVLSTGKYKDYPGWGTYSTYEMPKTVGYSGRYNGDDSIDKTSYFRVYVLETSKSFIPVLSLSENRAMMDSMNYVELAVIGSVRQAPLKASPIKQTSLRPIWPGFGSMALAPSGVTTTAQASSRATRLPPGPPDIPSRLTELIPIPTADCKAIMPSTIATQG